MKWSDLGVVHFSLSKMVHFHLTADIKYLQFQSKCGWPLCRLVAMLRLNLFTYRNLWDFLNDPFQAPPDEPPYQLALVF
jgi:hypothetical protein